MPAQQVLSRSILLYYCAESHLCHHWMRVQAVVSESDPELPAKQQASLLTAAMRTMALPLGRGALTLGLAEPLPGVWAAAEGWRL